MMKTYAAYYDNEIRIKSSSGGLFSLMASTILEQQGVVYGVAMTEDCYDAEFRRVTTENELMALRGSKYFQAKMGDAFRRVKIDLEEGKAVLFSGTGCQINGLRNFLQKEYDNLYCVDVICHGVPTPKLWKKYMDFQTSKYGEVKTVDFRSKDKGWQNFGMKFNDNYVSMQKDSFMQIFLRDYSLRPSCYACIAKAVKKSDITLGDFWGIDDVAPELNDNRGISLVIVRNEKGERLFEEIKGKLKYKEVKYEDATKDNIAEYKSVIRPEQRDIFFNNLDNWDYEKLAKKYAGMGKKAYIFAVINKIKRVVKGMIKGGK